MVGSLLFVHGTGVRDISRPLALLREHLCQRVGVNSQGVVGVEWGREVAPPRLDVSAVLPPQAITKGLGEEALEFEPSSAEVWELLLADPLLELRLMASTERTSGADQSVAVNADLAEEELRRRLNQLGVEPAAKTEITSNQLVEAAQAIACSDELRDAASAVGDANDEYLLGAASRSVVALLLGGCLRWDDIPRLCTDAIARDELVSEILAALAPLASRGMLSRGMKAVLLPLATKAAVKRRSDLMTSTTGFLADIAFYLRRGAEVRDLVKARLAEFAQDEPVVLLGHSLGGVVCVDLLAQDATIKVDLLVTVGSQAPLLYLMDALENLRPRHKEGGNRPFTPWLNIYDRADLLSFCAAGVWPNVEGIEDESVSSGVPFPAAHSAYWLQEELYDIITQRWPRHRGA